MYLCVVLFIVCFVTFHVMFVCICVLNNYHRVATQVQLNILYIISLFVKSRIVSLSVLSPYVTAQTAKQTVWIRF